MISLKQLTANKRTYLYLMTAYLIGVALVFLLSMVKDDGEIRVIHYYADVLLTFLQIVYAIVSAAVVFRDTFSKRSNQVEIPVQPPFRNKVLAGLIVSLISNLLVAAFVFIASEHNFLFIRAILIWLAYTVLIYFVFFCLAVFVVLSCKNTASAVVSYFVFIYGLLILLWSIRTLCIPLLYGIQLDYLDFREWMPAWRLHTADFLHIRYETDCMGNMYLDTGRIELVKEDWLYLFILLAIGVLSLLLSFRMYCRKKEGQKAFAAQIIPGLVSILAPLAAGVSLYQLAPHWAVGKYALLALGLTTGYFVYQILQKGQLQAFKLCNWLCLAMLVAIVAVSILTARFDLFGIATWTPDPAEVKSICYAEEHLNYYGANSFYTRQVEYENRSPVGIYNGTILTRDMHISKIIEIQKLHLANPNRHSDHNEESCTPITVLFTMNDGRQIERYYCFSHTDDAYQQLRAFELSPAFLLNIHSLDEWKNGLKYIEINKWNYLECTFAPPWDEKLLDAIYQDVVDGDWIIDHSRYLGSFHFEFTASDGSLQYVGLRYTTTATNTLEVLEQYKQAMSIE